MDIENFELISDKDAKQMAAYMKNKFPFVGVSAPERRRQSMDLVKMVKNLDQNTVREIIWQLYAREEREYQYVAIDVADRYVKEMEWDDILWLTQFVEMKSWWDNVDALRKVFGDYIKLHSEQKEAVFQLFYKHPSFWMRRVAITLQLAEKEAVSLKLLDKAIQYDIDTDEFFIQKAIGWALRQYSKTDSEWVSVYLNDNPISLLATREASKYLK